MQIFFIFFLFFSKIVAIPNFILCAREDTLFFDWVNILLLRTLFVYRNQWEILASTWFPEHIGEGDYKGIAMAEQALRDNGVLSRFASDCDMARWLTNLLGWAIDPNTLGKHYKSNLK